MPTERDMVYDLDQACTALDKKVQLHQSIEIHYMVSHYEATLYTTDGQVAVRTGIGDSIADALINLEHEVRGIKVNTIDDGEPFFKPR